MRIFILGTSGTVGGAVFRVLSDAGGYDVHGTFKQNKPDGCSERNWQQWDIADLAKLEGMLVSYKPELIISSLTGDFTQQFAAHVAMADYLHDSGGRMVFISSANVFDGVVCGNHTEAAPPYSISRYGNFKINCEKMLMEKLGSKCLVLRLPKILSNKSIQVIVRHIEAGNGVFTNLYFNCNIPSNAAHTLKYCIEENKSGVLHLVSGDCISDDELARRTLANAGIKLEYDALELSPERYCALLGYDDVSKLRPGNDNGFNLTMTCTDENIASKYGISCEDAIARAN